jgi:hypothetical protein
MTWVQGQFTQTQGKLDCFLTNPKSEGMTKPESQTAARQPTACCVSWSCSRGPVSPRREAQSSLEFAALNLMLSGGALDEAATTLSGAAGASKRVEDATYAKTCPNLANF